MANLQASLRSAQAGAHGLEAKHHDGLRDGSNEQLVGGDSLSPESLLT